MVLYETYNNTYVFKNGRVTCPAHNLWSEPVWNLIQTENGLKFRSPSGLWLTSPVKYVEHYPKFVLA